MKLTFRFSALVVGLAALILPLGLVAITPYEVVMVRGEVSYKGMALHKGVIVEAPDLRNPDLLKGEMKSFSFSGATDEVHLLDRALRKVVVVSARLSQPGRDLMLATRSLSALRSDFEFKRAFTPDSGLVLLVREDTLLCKGLSQLAFSGNRQLVIRYDYEGHSITRIIGQNDTLFLTRERWFGASASPAGTYLNSFGISGIRLLFRDAPSGKEETPPINIPPFSLVFLDDIIRHLASLSYAGVAPGQEEIFAFLHPALVKERQIQRAIGLYSPEEARDWLRHRIDLILTDASGK